MPAIISTLKNAFKTLFVERKIPWKIQRMIIFSRANNIRCFITKARFFFTKPTHRIVLSSHYLGGVGGTEKLVTSVIESMPDAEFYILADEVRFVGFYPKTYNYYVNKTPSCKIVYDAYLYFCGGGRPKYIGKKFQFKKRIVDTNAARIYDIENDFDHVLIQSTAWQSFTQAKEKCELAFPVVKQTIPSGRVPIENLPEKYLITVFNPFSKAQKGQEILHALAPNSRLPIVWCFSDQSGWDFASLPKTPNVIYLRNLTQEQLYYVYERAAAYVSFALYESYGWTLAEAFTLGLPIISRATGIIPYIRDQKGVFVYETEQELSSFLDMEFFPKTGYDEMFFVENSYPAAIERLTREV